MPNGGQIYNQYTKCVQPSGYGGLYLWGTAFTTGFVATLASLAIDPGAAPLAAILTAIGYCRWWLYARLVCLGNPNACTVGLVLRIDTAADQTTLLGKLDTDYTVMLLLPPNPLQGDPDWLNTMDNPTFAWTGELQQDQDNALVPSAPYNPEFVAMRQTYTKQQPYGFSGESVTGSQLQDHDGYPTLTSTQTQALNLLNPDGWEPGNFYNPGDQILDSNGGLETAVDQGLSGSSEPAWPNPDPHNWQPTAGQTTNDYGTIWRYDGPLPAVGALEVEFEGAGVWNLYQVLLTASPAAAGLAAACSLGWLTWLVCLIVALIFAAVVTAVGAFMGYTDNSAENDVNNQVGALTPGDVLQVSGRWVWDGGHIPNGWNELHPVLFAQKLKLIDASGICHDSISQSEMASSNPWANYPKFSPANLYNTLTELCGMVSTAQDPNTQVQQQLPQNGWKIHPLVDGCTAPVTTAPLQ